MRIMALLAVTAGVAMVESPYSASTYLHDSAALVILTLAALLWQVNAPKLSKVAVVIPWAFYLAFGLGLMNPQRPVLVDLTSRGGGTSASTGSATSVPGTATAYS